MNRTVFDRMISRIETGDHTAFEEIMTQYGPYCTRELVKKSGCTPEEAEEMMVEALLFFREQVISRRLGQIGNLKEYLALSCWEVWRMRVKQNRIGKSGREDIKQTFYSLSQKRFNRQVQEEIANSDESYLERVLSVTRSTLERMEREGQMILSLFYHYRRSLRQIAELLDIKDEETVKNLKSFYYEQWMGDIEREMAFFGYG